MPGDTSGPVRRGHKILVGGCVSAYAVPNVTTHPSRDSVPMVLLYDRQHIIAVVGPIQKLIGKWKIWLPVNLLPSEILS